jgi:Domain of unknown function (DUF4432)
MSDPDRPPSLFGRTLARDALRPLVGDLRQLAGVRRIALDDGPERGVRALAFSTGGGLDFWALADRSLDIGPLWWRGTPLAWASAAGFRSPALHDPEGDGGRGFNRSFSGFLVTCGLDHTRQPDGEHPLHGRLPYTPARLTAYGEDWEREEPILFCEGEAVQARYGSESLRLWRRIEAPVGGREIRIIDVVENLGAGQQRQSTLYHFNLGFPAVATGSLVRLGETVLLGPLTVPDAADAPRSESVPAGGDAEAACTVTTPVEGGDLVLTFAFATDTLPHLQFWRDLRPHAAVLGIEPCTSFRTADARSGPEPILRPGERRRYCLRFAVSGLP